MRNEPKRSGRRWVVWIAVILVVGAVGAGVAVAVRRGRQRTGLADQAAAAVRAGDRTGAVAILRQVLVTNPQDAGARARLLALLLEDQRYDEAEKIAREWTEVGPSPLSGWKALVEIALRRLRFDEADAIARSVADQDPLFAQLTFLRIGDLRGSLGDRTRSVDAAVSAASLASDGTAKAELLLFAAEALVALQAEAPGAAEAGLRPRARRAVAAAAAALERSNAAGRPLRELTARIQLLAENETEAELGARSLESLLGDDPKDDDARAALVGHHVRRRAFDSAAALTKAIARNPVLWLRSVRRIERGGAPVDVVLPLLDAAPAAKSPAVAILRAEALLRGSEAQKHQAHRLLKDLTSAPGSEPALRMEAYRLLAASGDAKDGLRLLEDAVAANPDVRTEALLASLLAGTPEGAAKALRLAAAAAGRTATFEEALAVVSRLRAGGPAALEPYLRGDVGATGSEGARRRFVRAAAATAVALREPKAADASFLRDAALADLVAAADGLDQSDLAGAWPLAVMLGRRDLAGRFLGQAASLEGSLVDLPYASLRIASTTTSESARAEFADGIEAARKDTGPRAFLTVLAEAVRRDRLASPELLADLERAAAEPASLAPALFLATRVAVTQGDAKRAEALARRLVEARPSSEEARAILGDLLLRRKAYDEVLALHPKAEGGPLSRHRQRALALLALGRGDEALVAARAAVAAAPESAEAHLVLAEVHLRAGRKAEALGTLSVAPLTHDVVLVRARLLAERGEQNLAEMLFGSLLRRGQDDLEAWRGYASAVGAQGRHDEVATTVTRRLDTKTGPPSPDLRADLLVLRAAAHQAAGRGGDALKDYEEAIGTHAKDVVALNNAAWLIVQEHPSRLADARAYVDRALAIAPDLAGVLDTASAVHHALGEHPRALDYAEKAIAASEKQSYMLRRARILKDLGRPEEARKQLEAVIAKDPKSREARAASQELGRDG